MFGCGGAKRLSLGSASISLQVSIRLQRLILFLCCQLSS